MPLAEIGDGGFDDVDELAGIDSDPLRIEFCLQPTFLFTPEPVIFPAELPTGLEHMADIEWPRDNDPGPDLAVQKVDVALIDACAVDRCHGWIPFQDRDHSHGHQVTPGELADP